MIPTMVTRGLVIRAAFFSAVLLGALACSGESTPLPCDVDMVLEAKCRGCHGKPREFGAPMSLLTWEHTQQPAPTDSSIMVWQAMSARVADADSPMPPLGNPRLEESERDILDAWFAAEAPPGDEPCM